MKLTKKQWMLVALIGAIALYFVFRKKREVLDAGNNKTISDLFDKLNPDVQG